MCGRLRVGKDFLHARRLVGAAMCSACLCGSHILKRDVGGTSSQLGSGGFRRKSRR